MVAIVSVLLPAFAVAQEQDREKKIQRSDLPQAVEKTVVEQSKGATIKGFSQEAENGQTFYEVEMKVNGHSKAAQEYRNVIERRELAGVVVFAVVGVVLVALAPTKQPVERVSPVVA
jgi:hypothetical protein